MVENLPSSAEDVGLIPGWRTKIPHVTGQLSLYPAARERGQGWHDAATSQGMLSLPAAPKSEETGLGQTLL